MTRSIYVAAPEGQTGKSVIALGLLDTLLREVESVGVFRPLVRSGHHDDILEMLLSQPGVNLSYDEAVGITYDEMRSDPESALETIVEKFVLQLEAQLADRGVTFDLSEEAVNWLAEKGYDSRMGARPLGRIIQQNIKQPLADEVLFGKLKKGGTVKVTVKTEDDGATSLALEAIEDGPVKPKPELVPKPKRAPRKRKPAQASAPKRSSGEGPGGSGGGKRGLVPKVPLKTS